MLGVNLGTLKKVNFRSKWSNKVLDFTPWFAEPEKIIKLGAASGLGLQVENIEVSV